jgi:RHS repeat-associated protein
VDAKDKIGKEPAGVRSGIANKQLRRAAVGLRARVTLDGGGAPMVLDELLSAVCTRFRAPARRPAASVRVYLYRNTAFGFPYSPATQISEGLAQRYTFQGREASAVGGPMFYRHRNYSAGLGRFNRRDPVLGGDPLFNAYGFPTHNPIMQVDPLGDRLRFPLSEIDDVRFKVLPRYGIVGATYDKERDLLAWWAVLSQYTSYTVVQQPLSGYLTPLTIDWENTEFEFVKHLLWSTQYKYKIKGSLSNPAKDVRDAIWELIRAPYNIDVCSAETFSKVLADAVAKHNESRRKFIETMIGYAESAMESAREQSLYAEAENAKLDELVANLPEGQPRDPMSGEKALRELIRSFNEGPVPTSRFRGGGQGIRYNYPTGGLTRLPEGQEPIEIPGAAASLQWNTTVSRIEALPYQKAQILLGEAGYDYTKPPKMSPTRVRSELARMVGLPQSASVEQLEEAAATTHFPGGGRKSYEAMLERDEWKAKLNEFKENPFTMTEYIRRRLKGDPVISWEQK